VSLEIRPVRSRRDLKRFIKLPWRLYRNQPNWIGPLMLEQRQVLDRKKNPFFEHAEAEYFLAWRDGEPVGRITAQVDQHFNEFQNNKWGLFGFFECENDPEAATALLRTAEAWLRERDRDRMVGPMDFTTNDPCGILIEGHERPPVILTPWSHRYYPDLLEGAGFGKAIDMFMWRLETEERGNVRKVIWDIAERVDRQGITVRNMRRKDMHEEVKRFLAVYNAAWSNNWGFVPLTENEVKHYAKQLKPLLDENWAHVAEKDGQVLGASLTLPDYNQVLAHMNGRILPFGWLQFLIRRRKIDRVRVFALGVMPEHQHTGIAARLYKMHWDAADRLGTKGGEMGWILETNRAMNKAMRAMGGEIVRKFRIYEKRFDGKPPGSDTPYSTDTPPEGPKSS
jgi:GNAT superfamily N-acetyltransferase